MQNKIDVVPLNDRILIERIPEEDKTKGGIIIPDSAREKPLKGKIVACGRGKILSDGSISPLFVSVGQKALFSKYSGTEITVDDKSYLMMREDDLLGIYRWRN